MNASKSGTVDLLINLENYKIISDNYNTLAENRKNTIKYLYSVRRSFLHLLVIGKDRRSIYKRYKIINDRFIKKSLIFFPQVLVETYLSIIYHTILTMLKK